MFRLLFVSPWMSLIPPLVIGGPPGAATFCWLQITFVSVTKDGYTCNDEETANQFNDYFTSIGNDLAKKFKHDSNIDNYDANTSNVNVELHTTLYGSAAGCRSIQKTCALWKHGLTSKNTHSQLTYFCKSNINQTFTNGGGMIWGVRIAIFTEIRHLVEELITFLSIFGPQKLNILTARLNKSLSISTSIQREGISVSKHAQNLYSQQD